MTRFARSSGSKSSNEKIPEDATSWKDMVSPPHTKQDTVEYNNVSEQQSKTKIVKETNKRNTWAVFDDFEQSSSTNSSSNALRKKRCKKETEGKNLAKRKKLNDEIMESNFDIDSHVKIDDLTSVRYISDEDKLKLNRLKNKLLKNKVSEESINKTLEFEKLKLFKEFKRKNCFNCKKSGHLISECPELKEKVKTTICYSCGSTEHTVTKCKSKRVTGNKFEFATCFICKEQGHISTECPDNPCGLYPLGGGCKECGEVTHFLKDCPIRASNSVKKNLTLNKINFSNIEGLEDEAVPVKVMLKNKCKIVKF